MRRSTGVFTLLLCLCALCAGHLRAAQNMIGRQSQNEGMFAVPAPGKVAIDGDLGEWDWSGRIWVFADTAVRDRYSVEAAAMWDADNLYLAAKWKDPLPMNSMIDPAFNPEEGWKEDSWQMRVTTADRTLWITTWYFAGKKQPVMHFAYWKNFQNYDGTEPAMILIAPPGGTELGQGAQMVYKADADGKGFSQEMRIPWKLLYKNVPPMKAGMVFRMGNEFLWGDPTGKTWPVHRYADNMQPGATSREFYWTARNAWGDVKLSDHGKLPVREYHADTGRIDGTIPVRATIPADATHFTIVIEDEHGARVRNLAGDCDPADYRVSRDAKHKTQTVEVKWDGLNDKGKLAAPGTYHVRGLTQKGLSAEYEMCYYNPGTPPWPTQDYRGAWGADHSAPQVVTAGGDWTYIGWPVVEGGCGIAGIDPTGQKRWSDRRSMTALTADDTYVYGYNPYGLNGPELLRYDRKTGATKPFILDGKERVFDLPVKEILGNGDYLDVTDALAIHGDTLALVEEAMNSKEHDILVLLDATSAQVKSHVETALLDAMVYAPDGALYAIAGGKLCRVNTTTGDCTPLTAPGLVKPHGLAIDKDGNLVTMDVGKDMQLKAFSPDGKPAYTCAKRGGRAIRGPWEPEGLTAHVSSVAVDVKGQVWAVENWNYPRRVSVWGRDGKLVRDYLGNTGYAGVCCYLHEQDPTLGYCGPMEFKLDKATRTWKLTQILWVPDDTKGESFIIQTGANTMPERFTSAASGTPHEYLYTHEPSLEEGTGNVIYMEKGGRWQPVSAVCLVGHISGKSSHYGGIVDAPSGDFAGLNTDDGVIWNDTNGDGKVQRSECTIVQTSNPATATRGGSPAFGLGNGWGGRVGDDMSLYTDGLTRWKPLRFTADGAPVYGLDGRVPLAARDWGDIVPIPGTHTLAVLSMDGYAGPTKLTGVDTETGAVQWYYANPYPGVHGSHNAIMPKPGLLIGPNKTLGTAHISDDAGTVFAIRGNLGQDFFLTSDGLYVGALFQDCRLPGESMPDTEPALVGMPLEGMTEGGEPFNGWFGKQADGKVRLTTGMAREAGMIIQIKGLETIQRFAPSTFSVTQPTLIQAERDNMTRLAAGSAPKGYTITRIATPPTIDGDGREWTGVPALTVAKEGSPNRAQVRLAYDANNLYLCYDVDDMSPWKNEGKDYTRLFKTGDAIDLQLCANPDASAKRSDVQAGDERLLISILAGKPAAILYRPIDKTAPAALHGKFASPVGGKSFDRIELLDAATKVAVRVEGMHYRVEASVPLAVLNLTPKSGLHLRGDMGVISSDTAGMIDVARTYWSNQATNLVNDLPEESWLYPQAWGELTLE